MIEFHDLLAKAGVDPNRVMVMRHRPTEKELRRALPSLATERHAIYNAYQSQLGERTESLLSKASHLASFIGHEAGHAMFICLYEVAGFERIRTAQHLQIPGNEELTALGSLGPAPGCSPLWFGRVGTTEMG